MEATEVEGNYVETYTGGGTKRVASSRPSRWKDTTTISCDTVSVFEEKELELYDCSYCHNYRREIGE